MVIHGAIPTAERLQKIGITRTNNCYRCNRPDMDMHHRFNGCLYREIWNEMKRKLGRLHKDDLPDERLIYCDFSFQPKQKQNAILFMIANSMYYIGKVESGGTKSITGWSDFLKKERFKIKDPKQRFGNFINLLYYKLLM